MTPRTKKTAAALSGALVLASGAYALGSQAGDGSALAGSPSDASRQTAGYGFGTGPGRRGHFRGGPRQALADAAKQLGVSEDKLLAALRKLRDDKRAKLDDLRAAFAKSLAAELGVSQDKVESALDTRMGERRGKRELRRDGRRGDMRNGFADGLAKELGIDAAKVRSALDEVHKTGGPPDLGALATKLGVTEAKLRAALQDLRGRAGWSPGHPPSGGVGGPHLRPDRDAKLGALAKDLGVSQAKLRDALKGVRDDFKAQRDKAIDEFAADLAKELGVSKAKVDDVIDSLGHHGRRGP
jgi:biotin operon repressor